MDVISLSILLEYLYKKFIVTFVLCLIGGIARETFNTVRMNKMDIKKLLISTIVASFIMCAVIDYVEIPFGVYTVICIICGMWSQTLLRIIMHTKFMTLLVGRILKKIKEPIIEEVIDTLDEINDTNNDCAIDKTNDESKKSTEDKRVSDSVKK